MHEISLEKYSLRTDLIIEREDIEGSKKETIIDKKYKVERIEDNNEKYISISFENLSSILEGWTLTSSNSGLMVI